MDFVYKIRCKLKKKKLHIKRELSALFVFLYVYDIQSMKKKSRRKNEKNEIRQSVLGESIINRVARGFNRE